MVEVSESQRLGIKRATGEIIRNPSVPGLKAFRPSEGKDLKCKVLDSKGCRVRLKVRHVAIDFR